MLTLRQLKKSVVRYPTFLELSLRNLQTKITYFDDIENAACRQDQPISLAALILGKAIMVYSMSVIDSIRSTVEFLCSTWSQPNTISMLRTVLAILALSCDRKLHLKVEFLQRMGYMMNGAIGGCDLAVSLHNHMLPRWHCTKSQAISSPNLALLPSWMDVLCSVRIRSEAL